MKCQFRFFNQAEKFVLYKLVHALSFCRKVNVVKCGSKPFFGGKNSSGTQARVIPISLIKVWP